MTDIILQIIKKVKSRDTRSIGIVMHNKPDGDAIGSAVALEKAFKKMGKRVVDVIIHDKINAKFSPLIGERRVNRIINPPEGRKYDVLFMVDFSDPDRTIDGLRRLSDYIIVIDHHILNEPYGNIYLCEDYPSTGAIIYEIIKRIVYITPEIATLLYLTLRSDTNSFKNSNTDSIAHKTASELLKRGADIDLINSIYENKTFSFIKLMGNTLSEVKINKKYKIAYLIITREMVKKSGASDEEVSALIEEFRYIDNIDISFLFIEGISNVRICGRSRNLSVNKVLEHFGGGGHPQAAGCAVYEKSISEVAENVVSYAMECIDKKII